MPIKPTKKQLNIMKEAWRQMIQDEADFYSFLTETEKWMSKETGIKDLEFFSCDGEFVGIGNAKRTMKLIEREKLEK